MPTQTALSIAQIVELPDHTQDAPSWVNDFTGLVRKMEKKTAGKTKRDFWVLTIRDTTGSAEIEMAWFKNPSFRVGDEILVAGKGMRRTSFNDIAKVDASKNTTINILRAGHGRSEPAPAGRGDPAPTDGAQAAQPAQAANGHANPNFHGQMKRMSILRLHCIDYASRIIAKALDAGMIEFTTVDARATAILTTSTSLFIDAQRAGMDKYVVPFGEEKKHEASPPAASPARPSTAPAREEPAGRANPPPADAKPRGGPDGAAFDYSTTAPDEDVPF